MGVRCEGQDYGQSAKEKPFSLTSLSFRNGGLPQVGQQVADGAVLMKAQAVAPHLLCLCIVQRHLQTD